MKKIIDGRRYDTENAELVAEFYNHLSASDFRYLSEDLYRTPAGSWFLHGEGGAMTQYSRPDGDGWTGGSDIHPLGEEDARQWLEDHDEIEALEKYFSEKIVDA
jgi:hypothetical protein